MFETLFLKNVFRLMHFYLVVGCSSYFFTFFIVVTCNMKKMAMSQMRCFENRHALLIDKLTFLKKIYQKNGILLPFSFMLTSFLHCNLCNSLLKFCISKTYS